MREAKSDACQQQTACTKGGSGFYRKQKAANEADNL